MIVSSKITNNNLMCALSNVFKCISQTTNGVEGASRIRASLTAFKLLLAVPPLSILIKLFLQNHVSKHFPVRSKVQDSTCQKPETPVLLPATHRGEVEQWRAHPPVCCVQQRGMSVLRRVVNATRQTSGRKQQQFCGFENKYIFFVNFNLISLSLYAFQQKRRKSTKLFGQNIFDVITSSFNWVKVLLANHKAVNLNQITLLTNQMIVCYLEGRSHLKGTQIEFVRISKERCFLNFTYWRVFVRTQVNETAFTQIIQMQINFLSLK